MPRKVGFVESKKSFRLFETFLSEAAFCNADFLVFAPDKYYNFGKLPTYRILKQRTFLDSLKLIGRSQNEIVFDIGGLVKYLLQDDIFIKNSNKTVVFKYINSIYSVVNNLIIRANKELFDSFLKILNVAKDVLQLEIKDKEILIDFKVSEDNTVKVNKVNDIWKELGENYKTEMYKPEENNYWKITRYVDTDNSIYFGVVFSRYNNEILNVILSNQRIKF